MAESDVTSSPQTTTISDASSIKAQNWGPITILFSAPSSCTATLTTQQPPYTNLFFGHWLDAYFDVSCFPTGTKKPQDLIQGQVYARWDYYYYSPAICPYGWTAATTFSSDIPGHDDTVFLSRGVETTAALCCPSGYDYFGQGHVCASTISQDQRVGYVSPTNTGNGWDRGIVSTSTVASETTVFGDAVQVWWQSSDEAVLEAAAKATPSAPDTSRTSSAAETGQTSPSTEAQTSSSTGASTGTPAPDTAGGLSTGAKAGIGVGIAAVAILATIVGVIMFRRRRKHRAQMQPGVGTVAPVEKYSHQAAHELPVLVTPVELHGYPKQTSNVHGRGL